MAGMRFVQQMQLWYSVAVLIITVQIIAGLILLLLGGELLVRGAVGLARRLQVPVLIIGLTIVAYGTSAPELFISVAAVFQGHDAVAFGNVVGSNISNTLLVLGASALIFPVVVGGGIARKESIFLLAVSTILYALALSGDLLRWNGAVLVALLAGFTLIMFRNARTARTAAANIAQEVEELAPEMKVGKAALLLLGGLVSLTVGSEILVPAAVELARIYGWSEALIGVTLIAVGGAAPELATSMIAALRKQTDIAIGNVIGSNLFNILGVLGLSSLIAPIEVDSRFVTFDVPFMIASSALLLLFMLKTDRLTRPIGALFVLGYVGYIVAQFAWLG